MKSFVDDKLKQWVVPHRVISMIRQIGEYKGKQELFKHQKPDLIENLRQVAVIRSTESSNRIEGIVADPKRLRAIVREGSKPLNRPESEIAGYRDVLSTIYESYKDIPFTPLVVLQFHRDLLKYTVESGGCWKSTDNMITTVMPDGSSSLRFQPVSAFETERYMTELHKCFQTQLHNQDEALLLIPAYVLDFLCIHPFLDGNGRLSRLLSTLLLHQQGYEVARYISLERVIEDSKVSYYDTLYRSSQGWHEGKHDVLPWIEYWLSTVLAAYRDFESRIDLSTDANSNKSAMVETAVLNLKPTFTTAMVCDACPGVSRALIKRVLADLQEAGRLTSVGRGRGAKWIKNG